MELMQANQQWSSRPADERYLDLPSMLTHFQKVFEQSQAFGESSRRIAFIPSEDHKGLTVRCTKKQDTIISPTHWAFGQLARLGGAPAGYLRKLPSDLAADNLNYGLQYLRDIEDVGLLLQETDGLTTMRAATGPQYGRIWNKDILADMVRLFGDGVSGDWRVPGEFGKKIIVDNQNTTLYASDQDMFCFLADEDHKIEVPNRRNGESGFMSRGFFIWNSEVGDCKFGISTFLFDYACCNRIVWGADNVKEITIRHSSGAPDKFLEQMRPALMSYANGAETNILSAIQAARLKRVGKDSDEVADFLAKRFTRTQSVAMMKVHEIEEGRPIENLWDATTAATAYARGVPNQNDRVDIERAAGKMMALAS